VPSSRIAVSSVFTSAIGQSLAYMPLLRSARIAVTSSIEVPYCTARRIRSLIGAPSRFQGVCMTVVSPITIPASFM